MFVADPVSAFAVALLRAPVKGWRDCASGNIVSRMHIVGVRDGEKFLFILFYPLPADQFRMPPYLVFPRPGGYTERSNTAKNAKTPISNRTTVTA
jgi:hypothetical protein